MIGPPKNIDGLCVNAQLTTTVSLLTQYRSNCIPTHRTGMLVVRVHVSGMMSPHGRSVIRVKVVGLYSQTSQGRGTLQSSESRSWHSTVKLVKVVGLTLRLVRTLPPLKTTPGRNVNGMPLSILLSLLLLNSHQNSLALQRSRCGE